MAYGKIKRASTGYVPRKHQAQLHNNLKRFNVLVCHRRFGKTTFSINEMIDQGLRCTNKNPQYAYLAPTYGQAKRVAWDFLKDFTKNLPNVKSNEADLKVEIDRPWVDDKVRFMLLGAENPGSLRGIYLDGVILDEYAEMDPTVWNQVIRPALSDRIGWAIFIGTPKGQNHFKDILEAAKKHDKDWFHCIFKASETKIVPITELEAAKQTMSEEEYNQEYECSFTAALVGAYYGKEIEYLEKMGRIKEIPHDPHLLVDTFWDLGIGDSTAIWFAQVLGQEIRVIDYVEDSGQPLSYYAKILKEGHREKYNYGTHCLPHDAAARSLETGRSRQESLLQLGIRTQILSRQKLEDGINAARMILPKCWFDLVKCERGLNALRNYQRNWDAKNKIFNNKPRHDWASHGADAFRYLALGLKEDHNRIEKKLFPIHAETEYDVFNF